MASLDYIDTYKAIYMVGMKRIHRRYLVHALHARVPDRGDDFCPMNRRTEQLWGIRKSRTHSNLKGTENDR
jgi:hypothetical protein